jgi:Domain of Unknown Function (DUF928)
MKLNSPTILGMVISLVVVMLCIPKQQNYLAAQQTQTKKSRPKLPIRSQPSAPPSRGLPTMRDGAIAPDPSPAQGFPAMQDRAVAFPPPPSRGFPAMREAAISRGNCFNSGAKLVALAPKFSQKALNSGESEEQSVWGKTTMEYPTFWFFVPFTDRSTQLEFVLQNREDEVVYSFIIPTPLQDGIVGVKIPKSQKPLVLDRPYRWTLKAKLVCGESAPEQRYVDGWIQRVGLPAGIDVVSNPAQVYVDRRVWYDAVNSLAEQRLKEPRNVRLKQDWRELLGAVKLEEFAVQPIIK